jgi:glucose-1-phosphate thymidylyltransferase
VKVIIPVAGAGTRLRPHTYTQPKPLIPVAGKPIIAFIIEKLIAVDIRDFVFVIGYLGEKIKDYIEETYPDINKTFVYQEHREGLGHAIWTARAEIQNEKELLIVLGDIIFDAPIKELLAQPNSCLCVKKVADPHLVGVVELEEGRIRKLVEKPNIPFSNLAIVGIYKVNEVKLLIDCIQQNIDQNKKTHGEFQLTDALMGMVDQGAVFTTLPVSTWFDCGKKDVLLETNRILLDEAYIYQDLPVFDNTIIVHPVCIGKDCRISNSIIGPHVTIGSNTTIDYSIVKDSIIGNYASLREVVLHQSIVGSDTSIIGPQQSLNIGDNTEIDFR